jgi:hypothetical protein
MRAGRKDLRYRKLLSTFDFNEFFVKYEGQLVFENMFAHFKKSSHFVILDSRTGLNEIGGICTTMLADAVVLVFRPNAAHEEGIAQVARAIRAAGSEQERVIPRLYVCSMAEPGQNSMELKKEIERAKQIVESSEGVAPVVVSHATTRKFLQRHLNKLDGHDDRLQATDSPEAPLLVVLPRRDVSRASTEFGSHLISAGRHESPANPMAPEEQDENELLYSLVAAWIRKQRANLLLSSNEVKN